MILINLRIFCKKDYSETMDSFEEARLPVEVKDGQCVLGVVVVVMVVRLNLLYQLCEEI